MINFSTQLPAVWTPPAAQAPLAVAAVAAIRPLQESGRNGQSGAEPEAQPPRQGRRRSEPESAPILPRKSGQEDGAAGASRSATAQAQRLAQADAEQRTEQEVAQQAAEAARREQMQSVLTNVWKASAAVVDRVLGRDDAAPGAVPVSGAAAGSAERAPVRAQPAEQLSLPWPVQPQELVLPAAMNDDRVPVAYDERGNSSLAPLEPGALISRRV